MTTMADYQHSPRIRGIIASIAQIACPPQLEELGLTDRVVDHVELTMRALPTVVRASLIAGLTAYDLAARAIPANLGKPARSLNHAKATAYFEFWRNSPIGLQRAFAGGIKGLLCLAFYEMDEAKAMIDYHPERWIAKVKRHRLNVYSDAIRKQQEAILAPDPLPLGDAKEADDNEKEAV